ncbi:endonuclease/exonuclease/phosphatase family protein, partial [bacterium]|nr:endonuclease/exonuclease/phosphatase family protein [bacterium]
MKISSTSLLKSALFALMTITPLFASAEDATTIRVGTYNIQGGVWVHQNWTTIVNDCIEAGLDIVGFQEVDRNTNRSHGKDTMEELSKASNGRYPYYGYSKAIEYDGGEYGTGILSSFPIESFDVTPLP